MKKILITDDDPFVASIYKDKFQAEGFEVQVAGDGKAALAQIASNPPDVVLLDLMLPEMDGVPPGSLIRRSMNRSVSTNTGVLATPMR